jgi:hypothetical protein
VDAFAAALRPDPAVALHPPQLPPPPGEGPLRKLQYVIELVGPRTAPAESVKAILQPNWQNALGQPQVFVMAGKDTAWRRLDPADMSGAYDSIALAWDLVGSQGSLRQGPAQHLLNVAENLANQLQRRAICTPMPDEVERASKAIAEAQEGLDIGVNLSVMPRYGELPEKEIWIACRELGLELSPTGLFEWRVAGWPAPLLGVGPLEADAFTLGQVQQGVTHEGVDVGFHVPLSPAPEVSLEGCFHVASHLAQRLHAVALDEHDAPLDDRGKQMLRANLQQALNSFRQVGIEPGSAEALKLFGD